MVLVVRSVSNGFNHYVPAAPLAKLMNLWKENLILWCWSSICRRIGSKSWWEELGRARVSIQNSDDAKWGPPFVHFPGPAAAWVPWSPGSRLPPPFFSFFFFSPSTLFLRNFNSSPVVYYLSGYQPSPQLPIDHSARLRLISAAKIPAYVLAFVHIFFLCL